MTRTACQPRRRRGSLVLELIFVLPILLVLLLGLFEFTLLFFARGEVVEACRAGARKASLAGATAEDVEDEVRNCLPARLREVAEIGVDPGLFTGDPVIVAVRAPMSAVSPDLLWPIGYSLQGQSIVSETRMTKE